MPDKIEYITDKQKSLILFLTHKHFPELSKKDGMGAVVTMLYEVWKGERKFLDHLTKGEASDFIQGIKDEDVRQSLRVAQAEEEKRCDAEYKAQQEEEARRQAIRVEAYKQTFNIK
jgi:3-phosphoglycerate kinase